MNTPTAEGPFGPSVMLERNLTMVDRSPEGVTGDTTFMDWFSRTWRRPRCPRDPSHLVGSHAHRVECLEVPMECAICGRVEPRLDPKWLTAVGYVEPTIEWAAHAPGPEWTHDPIACGVCKDTGIYVKQDAPDDAHEEPCHWCARGLALTR